jgi:hypothetical protein
MGILDDAIKEHLELKRRRGADPNEVERLEREALGPVRRGRQASEEAVLEDDGGLEDNGSLEDDGLGQQDGEPVLYDDQAGEAYAEPPELADEPAFAAEAEHEPFPVDESEQGGSHEPTEAWDTEEPLAAGEPDALAAEPPAPAAPAEPTPPPAPAEPRSDHAGGETVEYDVEAEEIKGGEETGGEEHKGSEDDPLEETPEFLQDTPDHDRLWFEQRPPKDFDFDK